MIMPSVRSAGAKSAPEGVACHRSAYVAEMWHPAHPHAELSASLALDSAWTLFANVEFGRRLMVAALRVQRDTIHYL